MKKFAAVVGPIKTQIYTFQPLLYQQIHFNQIKSKMATNNMSNIHISPDVLSTLMLLLVG